MKLPEELLQFVREHQSDDVRKLALQAKKYPGIDMEQAIRQIAGRKMAKDKVPAWYENEYVIYPKHLPLEQSSSQQTASFKASLCKGETMVDLTGGMGVDFYFLSRNFSKAVYVEKSPELTMIAQHNFDVLGLRNADVVNADAEEYLRDMQTVSMIYIDPARRDNTGRKTVSIEDCTPNLIEIDSLLAEKADTVMIKLSPMLDISLALKSLKAISDVYIIAVGNEVKELLFIKRKAEGEIFFHCINICPDRTHHFSFTRQEEENSTVFLTSVTGTYLYEPSGAILKSGAYKSVAKTYSLSKLHKSSHLYTSDVLHADFQGRKFIVETVCSLNKKDIREHLSILVKANITTRNFPLSVQEIRRKTGLKEGGDKYIFATTLADERKVLIICRKA